MRRATLQDEAVGGDTRLAAAAPRLRPTDVAVWEIALDAQPDHLVAQLRGTLSPDEEERADSFYFERDRRRFVVGRGVLRTLLGGYLGCEPEAVAFHYGTNGKPQLAPAGSDGLHFNLAHSEGLALGAFTRAGQVGVDVERVRNLPDWQYIAATCFSPSERHRVEAAAPAERQHEFFRAWTRQEAALKATGVGLGALPPPAAHADGTAVGGGDSSLVRVYPIPSPSGYAAAVAVSPAARWLTWCHWGPEPARGQARWARQSRRVRLEQSAQLSLHVL